MGVAEDPIALVEEDIVIGALDDRISVMLDHGHRRRIVRPLIKPLAKGAIRPLVSRLVAMGAQRHPRPKLLTPVNLF